MRKTLIIAAGAAVALVAAAVAMAAVFTATGVSATTATLTTDKFSDVTTRTCTGADNKSFAITHGHYTGMADFTTPATELDGPLTIHARTTVDTSAVPGTKLGYVEGSFRIKDDDTRVSGRFWGTLDASGKLAGFLTGSSHGSHAKVLGTLSGTFAPATGFVGSASLGANSSSAALAVVAGPVCKGPKPAPKPAPKPKPARPVEVKGDVTGLDTVLPDLSITVTPKKGDPKTCAIDGSSPSTALFPVGTKDVEMKCMWVGTPTAVLTLRELHKHK